MENNWHSVNKRSGPETVGLWNKALDTGCPPAGKWGLYRTCCSFWCTLQKAQCAMKSEHTISAQEMSPYTCVRLYRGLKLGFKNHFLGIPTNPVRLLLTFWNCKLPWPPANPLTYQKHTYKVHRVCGSRVIDSLAARLLYFEFVYYIKSADIQIV